MDGSEVRGEDPQNEFSDISLLVFCSGVHEPGKEIVLQEFISIHLMQLSEHKLTGLPS